MKLNFFLHIIAICLLLLFTHCNSSRYAKYQNSAYKKVHHKIEKTTEFEKYNKYQQDFLILANTVKDAYPNYQEYITENEWITSVNISINNLKNANDTIAILEYQKFLAKLRNNHTQVVYPMIYNMGDKIFLFVVYQVNNKWTILDIHADYSSDLLKSELLKINNIPIDSFFNVIKPYLNEESNENLYHSAASKLIFGRQVFLKALGLEYEANPDSMLLTIKDSSNIEKNIMIHAVKLKGNIKWSNKKYSICNTIVKTDSGYIYRFFPSKKLAYLQINTFIDKKAYIKGIKEEVPIVFWPFAFNMLRNAYKGKPSGRLQGVKPGTEDITKFYEDFFTKLKNTNSENLIIDIRNNSGGDIFYTYQLLSFLTDKSDIKTYTMFIKYSDFYKQFHNDKKLKKNIQNLQKKLINFDTLINVSKLEDDYKVFENIENPQHEYFVNSRDKKFKGNIYVLISPNSASAATVFPVLVQDNKIGAIVGRSPANRVAKQSSFTKFRLPNTSIVISMSPIYFVRPNEQNTNEILIPDYYVPSKISEEDYTLQYVFKLIENNKK